MTARLTKADGKGTWWQGLDPQELYCKLVVPITDDGWSLDGADWDYVAKYFNRTKDLIDTYRPDLLMFDDNDLPFGEVGLRSGRAFLQCQHPMAQRQERGRDQHPHQPTSGT